MPRAEKKNWFPRILYIVIISYRNKGKIKTFSNEKKKKLRESVILNEWLKEVVSRKEMIIRRNETGDFPGGPVAKILCSPCRGLGFDP